MIKTGRQLAVATTFCFVFLTPMALAEDLRVVRYSKNEIDDFSKKEFIQSTDLSDVLAAKIKILASTLTQRQGGNNAALRNAMAEGNLPSKSIWWRRLSTLAVDPDSEPSKADSEKIRVALAQQTRKASEVKFKDAFPIIETIRSGLSLNLDLRSPGNSLHQSREIPNIRYGLVETEILPGERSTPIANLGTISDIDPSYLGQARVVYTIDKVTNEPSRQVFQDYPITSPADDSMQNMTIWKRTPSTAVNLKVDAADQEATMSDKVSNGSIPGARFTLTQADGLVSAKFVAGGNTDVKKSLVTEIKAPLYGEMSICRTFNHKMKAKETSALNILGSSNLPRLNLVYAHEEQKAKAEWVVKKSGFEYSVIAEPRVGWSPSAESKLGEEGDKLSVNVITSF